jgi:hypothetical protein
MPSHSPFTVPTGVLAGFIPSGRFWNEEWAGFAESGPGIKTFVIWRHVLIGQDFLIELQLLDKPLNLLDPDSAGDDQAKTRVLRQESSR